MSFTTKYQNIFKLHFIVFILGFTAILGKLIEIPAIELVWYRMMFAFIAVFFFLKFRSINFAVPRKELLKIVATGLIVAAHWIFFFHSIKVSNVSVALGCLSSGTLFASILEPLIERRKISWLEIVIGIIIIFAIYIIFQFEMRYYLGIIFSIICAFLSSLFTVINKNLTARNNANVITFYEMIAGFAGVSIYMLLSKNISEIQLTLTWNDFIFLALLGTVCTAYAFVATVDIMKQLSAYTIVLSINLEPVYGILLAFFIFGKNNQLLVFQKFIRNSNGFFHVSTPIITHIQNERLSSLLL